MVMENRDIEHTDIDYFEIVVTKTYSNQRIDRLLSDVIEGVSRSRLKRLIDSEFIRLNGIRTEPSHITKIGEIIQIHLPEPELINLKPQEIHFDQIYEDDNLLVMNKRANLVMHPGNGNYENTILNGLLFKYSEARKLPRAGIVHRLDKDTTGLVVVAKNRIAFDSLSMQILKRNIRRCYLALVWGNLMTKVEIEGKLERDRANRLRFMISKTDKGKFAHTTVIPIKTGHLQNQKVTLVKCVLNTGRTHQIRVHMEGVGHPIVGDVLYKRGSPRHLKGKIMPRQALHAFSLAFFDPIKKYPMTFQAPPPDDLKKQIREAGICLHQLSE
ncbi:MAG: RluA family pseudouridine synthase [Verrucomicrobiales bacterium]|nr:RluA family pseudouridine synthase [Verrucomicrobiales bacterium]